MTATTTIINVTKVVPTKSVVLTLNPAEAQALRNFMEFIGGNALTSSRVVSDRLITALAGVGVRYQPVGSYGAHEPGYRKIVADGSGIYCHDTFTE